MTTAGQLPPSSESMTVKYGSLPENSDPETSGAVIFSSTPPVKPGPDPKCHNYGDMPLSKDEKDHILELHNKFRSNVALGKEKPQPPAGNMRQMSWDKELEKIAERWADRCNSYSTDTPHDKCRRSKRFQVGQNVATYGSSAKPFSPDSHARTMEWFKEIKYFKPEWINSYRQHHEITEKTGHYAQFIWAESFLIGCARVIFEETVDNSTYTFDRLVCNYGPSGNVEGSPVYRSANPCLACPKSTSCSPLYKGLCASPEQIKEVIALKHELEGNQPDRLKKKQKTPALKTSHKNPSSYVKKPPINIMMKSPQITKTLPSDTSVDNLKSKVGGVRHTNLRLETPDKIQDILVHKKNLEHWDVSSVNKQPQSEDNILKYSKMLNTKSRNSFFVRGGKRSEYHLYRPNENGNFECFTTGMEIDPSKINDDYCDCEEDGSDEPGTSACQNGRFHCNTQLALESIPSHRVNDGICDCCDGSDEWAVKRLHFRLAGLRQTDKRASVGAIGWPGDRDSEHVISR
uniref:SCP domain-containing protein n=1 Tax=Timema poppense TaxID=170557 RepID=A0A7R9D155_TIMPO|nr:unnamed protein product [Timema poppensis]